MAIITLTSDWGLKDYYAGAVKGAILRLLPEARRGRQTQDNETQR